MAALEHSKGKVAITGSSGILGQRLYTALQADGWEVVGLGLAEGVSQGGPGRDGASETRNELWTLPVICRWPARTSPASRTSCIWPGVGSPDASFEQVLRGNVVATQHVLEAAKRSGTVKRVVLASTNHVQTGTCMASGGPGTRPSKPGPEQLVVPPLNQMTISNRTHSMRRQKYTSRRSAPYGKTWRCFDVVALRIGWCLYDDPTELAGTQYEAYIRAMWLSRPTWVDLRRPRSRCLSSTDTSWLTPSPTTLRTVRYGEVDQITRLHTTRPIRQLRLA